MSRDAELGNTRIEEFLRLLGQHDRRIYAYILALLPNWADADDLSQEVRIRLWQQFDKYQPGTDFGAWARSIAYYLVLAHREKTSRSRLRFGDAFYDSVSAQFTAQPDILVERQQALVRCLEKLNHVRRGLIEDYYAGKWSLREIAKAMGRSYDATRKALYRTQLDLANCIESEIQRKRVEL